MNATAGLKNSVGSFDWEVPADLGNDKTYGIKIVLQSDAQTFQFSFPFAITPSKGGVKGNSTSTSKPAKPTSTSSSDEEEETSSSEYKPKTTLYTTVDDATPAPTAAPKTVASPGAGPQITAGAFAVLGGLAIAAIGL